MLLAKVYLPSIEHATSIMNTFDAITSGFSPRLVSSLKGKLLSMLLAVPVFAGNVNYSPTPQALQGVLPFSQSYVLTITSPGAWPAGASNSITFAVAVTTPAGISNSLATSYITLSPSSLTFNAANQSQTVTVTGNFPAGIPAGLYAYQITTSGWPNGISPAAGFAINASVSVPPPAAGVPVVTITSPTKGQSFTATSFTPYFGVTLNYGAVANGGADISSESIVLNRLNPDGTITALTSLTGQMSGQTITGGPITLQIPSAGNYSVTVSASNGTKNSSDTSLFSVTAVAAPPTVTIASPANGSAFTLFPNTGGLNIPITFSGASTLIGISSLTATLDGTKLSPTLSGILSLLASGSTSAQYTSTVPSTHTLVVTATDINNQSVSATSTFTINVFAISWPVPAAITYGTPLSSTQLNATTSLTGPNGPLAAVPGTLSYSPVAGTVLPAGNQTLTVTFTPTDPTAPKVTQTVPLVVTPVPLTITALGATRPYGAANPGFSASYAGFIPGESASVLGGSPALSTTALATSPAGSTFPIAVSQGTITDTNYTYTFVTGTLTITKAPLTITANNASKTYGAANPTLSVSYSAFANGETASVLGGLPALATTATSASPVGTYPITATIGTITDANYSYAFVNGTLTVNPASLTITADNKTMVQGAAVPALTASYSGFVNGDTPAVVTGVTLATTGTSSSPVGTYPITVVGGTANNYTITQVAGTLTVTAGGTPHNITGIVFFDTNCDGVYNSTPTCQDAYCTARWGCNDDGWNGYNAYYSSYSSWGWGGFSGGQQWGCGSYSNQIWGNSYQNSWNGSGQSTSGPCDFGLSGITVNLLNAANVQVATTVSDKNGAYTFAGVMPGSYYVIAVATPGLKASTPNDVAVTVTTANVTVPPIGFSLDFNGIQKLKANCKSKSYWCSDLDNVCNSWCWWAQPDGWTVTNCTNNIGNLCTGVFAGINLQSADALLHCSSSNANDQLAQSLLAAEYNCTSGSYINNDSNLTYLFIWWGECVLTNPNRYTPSYQTWAKSWFDAYNNCQGGAVNGPSS